MARIRTIKPEFWSSPGHEDLDPWARLLYIAMWNWADDYGRGVAHPKELAAFAFPNDDAIGSADIRRMLGWIHRAFGVEFYTVGGRPYFAIPTWDKHQKIDKRSQPRYPAPDEGDPYDPDPIKAPDLHKPNGSVVHIENSENPAESSPSPRRDLDAGNGKWEQGNRGKDTPSGVSRARTHASAPARGPSRSTASGVTIAGLAATAHKPQARQIVDAWHEHHGRMYPSATIRELCKQVDVMLADRCRPEVITDALERWHERDAAPGLLRHLYVDALKARDAANKPAPLSKRDEKALGWYALADQFADETSFDGLTAIEGGQAS